MRSNSFAILATLLLALSACASPYVVGPAPFGPAQEVESRERAVRFSRLGQSGVAPPQVREVRPRPAGPYVGLPVVLVTFDERAFFGPGSDRPSPGATPILDTVAEAMRRDVPGAQLTLLGHTDATGSDSANDALSMRRARAVFSELAARGVDERQLSTVAIGRRQPVASNATEAGRARNRRVEFLVSSSLAANLAVVQERPVPYEWLQGTRNATARAAPAGTVQVLRPQAKAAVAMGGPADISESMTEGAPVTLAPPTKN